MREQPAVVASVGREIWANVNRVRDGGREGGWEGGRKKGEGLREGGREGGREEWRERGREEGRKVGRLPSRLSSLSFSPGTHLNNDFTVMSLLQHL